MWALFAVLSLVAGAIATTIDKVAVVEDKKIDTMAATTLRLILFWLWVTLFGVFGFMGDITIFLPWPIFALGILFGVSSVFYTYLLKHVEATGSSAVSYAAPFFYLLVDAFIIKAQLSGIQVAGVLLLTVGGMLFAVNPHRLQFKKEFTRVVCGIFAFDLVLAGIEYYSFKFYFDNFELNEVSFYFNGWAIAIITLLVVLIARGKVSSLWHARGERRYLQAVVWSKGLDTVSALFWLHAIAQVAVSQVNALNALYPLILVAVVYIAQNMFGYRAEEKFARGHLAFKLAAITLLCIGGFFIR